MVLIKGKLTVTIKTEYKKHKKRDTKNFKNLGEGDSAVHWGEERQ